MAKKDKGTLGIVAAIVLIELLALAFIVPRSMLESLCATERVQSERFLGEDSTSALMSQTDGVYRRAFVDSGVQRASFRMFVPDADQRARSTGLERLGVHEGFWETVIERLSVIWLAAYLAVFRLLSCVFWLPVFLGPIAAAVFSARRVKRLDEVLGQMPNSFWHSIARKTVFVAIFGCAIFAIAPVPAPPQIVPLAWAVTTWAAYAIVRHFRRV